MFKPRFKVGDFVQITQIRLRTASKSWKTFGVGRIICIDSYAKGYRVEFKATTRLFYDSSLELAYIKGQQLLFGFAYEN